MTGGDWGDEAATQTPDLQEIVVRLMETDLPEVRRKIALSRVQDPSNDVLPDSFFMTPLPALKASPLASSRDLGAALVDKWAHRWAIDPADLDTLRTSLESVENIISTQVDAADAKDSLGSSYSCF